METTAMIDKEVKVHIPPGPDIWNNRHVLLGIRVKQSETVYVTADDCIFKT